MDTAEKILCENHALLDTVKSVVLRDLRPVRPLLPAGTFVTLFMLAFVGLVLLSTRILNPVGWNTMPPLQRTAMFLTLAASAGLLAFTLSQEMVPGKRTFAPGAVILGPFVLACLVVAASFQVRTEADFLKTGERCLEDGIPYAVPGTALFAFILRRGAVLSPLWSAAMIGMLAGLVSTSALEIHCPDRNSWHVLVFHFGIPAATTAVGTAAVWLRRKWSDSLASHTGKLK